MWQSYAMSGTCRGKLLLICNDEFHGHQSMSARAGADVDVRNIMMLFKRLHFDVIYHSNLTATVNTLHYSLSY